MGAAMVTLSTVTLSQIDRRNLTSASSIYTLVRREAGNVAHALLATIVAQRTRYHHLLLAHNISRLNPIYRHTRSGAVNYLKSGWLDSNSIHKQGVALIADMENRQSRMMAYNDAFFVIVPMFLLILPFILLLLKHGYKSSPFRRLTSLRIMCKAIIGCCPGSAALSAMALSRKAPVPGSFEFMLQSFSA